MKTEFLIVGQGLAGTILAHEFLKRERNFVLIDEFRENTSSKISAGIFSPISGKRMTKMWNIDELKINLSETYFSLEKLLACKLLYEQNIYQIFGSVKEQNDLTLRLNDSDFSKYININPKAEKDLKQPFGAFEINGSGWVDVNLMLNNFANLLIERNLFIKQQFDYADLTFQNKKWIYKNIEAEKIAFCEGYKNNNNPYFNYLPFVPCKGEVLVIKCRNLLTEKIIKKGIYLVHLYDDFYKVGATYEWNDLNETPSEKGLNFLEQKLTELINLPFEIVKNSAAIRPTVKDRMPIIGSHPTHENMFILNGLGTKGVLLAPLMAKLLTDFILDKKEINNEISIDRFSNYFELGS